MRFRALIILASIAVSAGCGQAPISVPTGIHVDQTVEEDLVRSFNETLLWTGFERGDFYELAIVVMPATFPCPHYEGKCSGEYLHPNTVKIGNYTVFRHEIIHYLLDLNTRDFDPEHLSPLFKECENPPQSPFVKVGRRKERT